MQSEFLQKLISLVARTGHTMVVPDPTTGKSYVVMELADYEKLLGGISTPQETPQAASIQPSVTEPVQSASRGVLEQPISVRQESNKTAVFSQKKASESTSFQGPSGDLTQEELLDKINRDIGDWKTAQERKRAEVLQSAAEQPAQKPVEPQLQPQVFVESALEEEERFYLEPIE
jgi:hypothetical protein